MGHAHGSFPMVQQQPDKMQSHAASFHAELHNSETNFHGGHEILQLEQLKRDAQRRYVGRHFDLA
jgi:hypothetical protein